MFDRNLISNKYLNPNDYLDSFKVNFLNAKPFPSIVIKDFFEDSFLSKVLEDFPDLEKIESSQKYNNQNEFKFASNDYNNFPNSIKKDWGKYKMPTNEGHYFPITFDLKNLSRAMVSCHDWNQETGIVDNLKVAIFDSKYSEYLKRKN